MASFDPNVSNSNWSGAGAFSWMQKMNVPAGPAGDSTKSSLLSQLKQRATGTDGGGGSGPQEPLSPEGQEALNQAVAEGYRRANQDEPIPEIKDIKIVSTPEEIEKGVIRFELNNGEKIVVTKQDNQALYEQIFTASELYSEYLNDEDEYAPANEEDKGGFSPENKGEIDSVDAEKGLIRMTLSDGRKRIVSRDVDPDFYRQILDTHGIEDVTTEQDNDNAAEPLDGDEGNSPGSDTKKVTAAGVDAKDDAPAETPVAETPVAERGAMDIIGSEAAKRMLTEGKQDPYAEVKLSPEAEEEVSKAIEEGRTRIGPHDAGPDLNNVASVFTPVNDVIRFNNTEGDKFFVAKAENKRVYDDLSAYRDSLGEIKEGYVYPNDEEKAAFTYESPGNIEFHDGIKGVIRYEKDGKKFVVLRDIDFEFYERILEIDKSRNGTSGELVDKARKDGRILVGREEDVPSLDKITAVTIHKEDGVILMDRAKEDGDTGSPWLVFSKDAAKEAYNRALDLAKTWLAIQHMPKSLEEQDGKTGGTPYETKLLKAGEDDPFTHGKNLNSAVEGELKVGEIKPHWVYMTPESEDQGVLLYKDQRGELVYIVTEELHPKLYEYLHRPYEMSLENEKPETINRLLDEVGDGPGVYDETYDNILKEDAPVPTLEQLDWIEEKDDIIKFRAGPGYTGSLSEDVAKRDVNEFLVVKSSTPELYDKIARLKRIWDAVNKERGPDGDTDNKKVVRENQPIPSLLDVTKVHTQTPEQKELHIRVYQVKGEDGEEDTTWIVPEEMNKNLYDMIGQYGAALGDPRIENLKTMIKDGYTPVKAGDPIPPVFEISEWGQIGTDGEHSEPPLYFYTDKHGKHVLMRVMAPDQYQSIANQISEKQILEKARKEGFEIVDGQATPPDPKNINLLEVIGTEVAKYEEGGKKKIVSKEINKNVFATVVGSKAAEAMPEEDRRVADEATSDGYRLMSAGDTPPAFNDYKDWEWHVNHVLRVTTTKGEKLAVAESATPQLYATMMDDVNTHDTLGVLKGEGYQMPPWDIEEKSSNAYRKDLLEKVVSVEPREELTSVVKFQTSDGKKMVVCKQLHPVLYAALIAKVDQKEEDKVDDIKRDVGLPNVKTPNDILNTPTSSGELVKDRAMMAMIEEYRRLANYGQIKADKDPDDASADDPRATFLHMIDAQLALADPEGERYGDAITSREGPDPHTRIDGAKLEVKLDELMEDPVIVADYTKHLKAALDDVPDRAKLAEEMVASFEDPKYFEYLKVVEEKLGDIARDRIVRKDIRALSLLDQQKAAEYQQKYGDSLKFEDMMRAGRNTSTLPTETVEWAAKDLFVTVTNGLKAGNATALWTTGTIATWNEAGKDLQDKAFAHNVAQTVQKIDELHLNPDDPESWVKASKDVEMKSGGDMGGKVGRWAKKLHAAGILGSVQGGLHLICGFYKLSHLDAQDTDAVASMMLSFDFFVAFGNNYFRAGSKATGSTLDKDLRIGDVHPWTGEAVDKAEAEKIRNDFITPWPIEKLTRDAPEMRWERALMDKWANGDRHGAWQIIGKAEDLFSRSLDPDKVRLYERLQHTNEVLRDLEFRNDPGAWAAQLDNATEAQDFLTREAITKRAINKWTDIPDEIFERFIRNERERELLTNAPADIRAQVKGTYTQWLKKCVSYGMPLVMFATLPVGSWLMFHLGLKDLTAAKRMGDGWAEAQAIISLTDASVVAAESVVEAAALLGVRSASRVAALLGPAGWLLSALLNGAMFIVDWIREGELRQEQLDRYVQDMNNWSRDGILVEGIKDA